jgi:hypothetical protein
MSDNALTEFIEARELELNELRGPFAVPEWADYGDGRFAKVYATTWTIAKQQRVSKFITADDPEGFSQVVWRFALNSFGVSRSMPKVSDCFPGRPRLTICRAKSPPV